MAGAVYGFDPLGDWLNADDVVSGLYAGWHMKRFDFMDGLVATGSSIIGRKAAASAGFLNGGTVPTEMMIQSGSNALIDMLLSKRGSLKSELEESLEVAAVGKIGGQIYHAIFGKGLGLAAANKPTS